MIEKYGELKPLQNDIKPKGYNYFVGYNNATHIAYYTKEKSDSKEKSELNIFQESKDINEIELEYASDYINQKYGSNTITKASALTTESNLLERSKLIGGHNAK